MNKNDVILRSQNHFCHLKERSFFCAKVNKTIKTAHMAPPAFHKISNLEIPIQWKIFNGD